MTNPVPPVPAVKKDHKGFAIAGFISSLFSLGTWMFPLVWVLLSIAGIYLGAMGLHSSRRVLAILGIVFASIAIVLGIGKEVRDVILELPQALQQIPRGY